jgi:hypothetical protein
MTHPSHSINIKMYTQNGLKEKVLLHFSSELKQHFVTRLTMFCLCLTKLHLRYEKLSPSTKRTLNRGGGGGLLYSCNDAINNSDSYTRGAQISPKSSSHLKILGAGQNTWIKFHTEDPQNIRWRHSTKLRPRDDTAPGVYAPLH